MSFVVFLLLLMPAIVCVTVAMYYDVIYQAEYILVWRLNKYQGQGSWIHWSNIVVGETF